MINILKSAKKPLQQCFQLAHTTHKDLSSISTVKKVNIKFKFSDGTVDCVAAKIGDTLLDVVIDNKVDIDGFGACDGTLSCSTCHLILTPDDYNRLPNKPTAEEIDMLDLAFGVTDT